MPYLAEAIPHSLSEAQVHVRVLTAARTFWEKATILHMLHYQPEGWKIAPRMSRHYYDVFQLSQGDIWEQSLDAMDLLERVVVSITLASLAPSSRMRGRHLMHEIGELIIQSGPEYEMRCDSA